jgi:hypothetical protein
MVFFDAGAALGSAFGGLAAVACTPLGLAVTVPQAYALVGVAGMLASTCQVRALLARMVSAEVLSVLTQLARGRRRHAGLHLPGPAKVLHVWPSLAAVCLANPAHLAGRHAAPLCLRLSCTGEHAGRRRGMIKPCM